MSKHCDVCGKGPIYGNTISHSNKKTRRRWEPNLRPVRILVSGSVTKARVCTRCIRSGKVTKAG